MTVYGLMHNQNRDMKWEIKKEFDVGLDFSLFNRRLNGRMDYFSRKIEDAIYSGIPVASPPAVYATSTVNIGDITNKGFEFELNGRVVDTKDWTFDTSLVASFVIWNFRRCLTAAVRLCASSVVRRSDATSSTALPASVRRMELR